MSNLSQFYTSGPIKPTGLINGTSGFPFQTIAANALSVNLNGYLKNVNSGALTAAALSTILSLSGKGCISFLAFQGVDNTSRTHRARVTLDGVVIFDATSSAITGAAAIGCAIGQIQSAVIPTVAIQEPLRFDKSLLVEYASSLTETDKTLIAYRYVPR